MQYNMFIFGRNGLAKLLLSGAMTLFAVTSAGAADYFTSTQGGYPGGYPSTGSAFAPAIPQEQDAVLQLASRSVALTPAPPQQEEKKKSPWWSVFSSKKDTTPPTTPNTPASPSSNAKFKSSKAEPKSTPMLTSNKSKDPLDSGQAEVAALTQEKRYSEADYIASAMAPKDTKARNLYNEGLLAESQGRHQDAVRAFNGFIKANERSTTNGVLATPYHRLAMISWKEGSTNDAGIYFRHALNYALGGNLLIIGGDYAQFLMVRGDYARAEVVLRNALLNDPENKRLLFFLGRCVALQKKHQESLRYLDASVGRAQAYQELAAIYRQQGEFELARVAEERRNAHIAGNRPMPPAPSAGHPMGPSQQQAMMPPPTAVYPPNSALGQAVAPQQQPTLERQPNTQDASTGWGPPPAATPQPVPQTTPVSKVYHYPSNSPSPVYYQYTGSEYPQSPSSHPWEQPMPTNRPSLPNMSQAKGPDNVGWNPMITH